MLLFLPLLTKKKAHPLPYHRNLPIHQRNHLKVHCRLEKEMKKIIKEGKRLEKFTLPREEAIQLMKDKEEPYKVELIEDLPEDAEISFYKQGEGFTDLCAGPHLMSTKPVKAFKLISSSMAASLGGTDALPPLQAHGSRYGGPCGFPLNLSG